MKKYAKYLLFIGIFLLALAMVLAVTVDSAISTVLLYLSIVVNVAGVFLLISKNKN